ncbi:hypothetical protein [Coprococcus sp. B2-R-112]|uniref:hypothetical protein n=1 Tax=Coprococcus sp. B2-R-112 TaxID=2949662 RepID=UPI00202EF335|nr:hypothetical protein [Coprococcus sp. B2-R-112]MCM0662341.1 hypothetical protein [Coprococcus sp. B2-R-112]
MKFRKKPVEVEAFKLSDDPERMSPDWFTKAVADERIYIDRVVKDGHIDVYGCTIRTQHGKVHAKLGDYVIKGINGELYPCKADIFKKTYERY